MKKISFTITTKRIKQIGINLRDEDLYTENYTILLKEIEAGIKKWEDILCS